MTLGPRVSFPTQAGGGGVEAQKPGLPDSVEGGDVFHPGWAAATGGGVCVCVCVSG